MTTLSPALLDNSKRMRLAQLTQWARAIMALILLAALCMQQQLLRHLQQGQFISQQEVDQSDWIIRTVSWVQIGVIILALVAFILWFYRAYQNVHRLPMAQPELHEAAAGWSWFVPVVNLWYPYRIMQEIGHYFGRYSHPRETVVSSKWDFVLIGWWALYLIGIIMGRINLFVGRGQPETFAEILLACHLQMMVQVIMLLSSATTLILLRMIAPHEQSLETRHELAPAALEAPDAGPQSQR